ncbi:MAG: type II toxin-antitoxin system RelB/DinJ family antitoxin [Synergistaceae bacterium]|nr:type II toxin-antitoxin system RelB/DinJ family antitoxin [Synergistaceae bacterium]
MNASTLTLRVDRDMKENAMRYAGTLGISLSSLVRAFLAHCLADGGVPFDLGGYEVPNKATLASIRETQRGRGLKEYASVQDMADDLGL